MLWSLGIRRENSQKYGFSSPPAASLNQVSEPSVQREDSRYAPAETSLLPDISGKLVKLWVPSSKPKLQDLASLRPKNSVFLSGHRIFQTYGTPPQAKLHRQTYVRLEATTEWRYARTSDAFEKRSPRHFRQHLDSFPQHPTLPLWIAAPGFVSHDISFDTIDIAIREYDKRGEFSDDA
ncbi:hypothetical protein B0H14DRAFT_2584608 [Mycena olivaceomarginata]|nr:hypothetical protein B0H14DRAFT_2584608 [Mycena olivaceomarginata]